MKLWPFALLAPALVAGVAIWAISKSRSDTLPTEIYGTRAEAEAHAAFAPVPQGWLPKFIPEGATAIRTTHNPSTHQSWGDFHSPPANWIPAGASKTPPRELMLLGAPSAVTWWPAFLRGRIASGDLAAQGFHFAFIESEASPLMVAVRGDQVYWWRLARQ
jgi:hypothetical protein